MGLSTWWRRKRRQLEMAWELHRQRRAVARHKRLIAAEQKRRQSEGTGPGAYLRFQAQRFAVWRARRALQRQERLHKFAANHRWFQVLQRRQTLLVGLFLLALVGAFCVALFLQSGTGKRQQARASTVRENEPIVEVNGKTIPRAVFERTLELKHGSEILQSLTEQELVRQEAERLHIVLSTEETARIQKAIADDPLRQVHEPELRTALLLRKIALKDVTDTRRREVYQTFQADLTTYTLQAWRFQDREFALKFEQEVRKSADPKKAAARWALDGERPEPLEPLSLPAIQAALGRAAAQAVRGLQPGQFTQPLTAGNEIRIYQVLKVASAYEEVQPALDALLGEAGAARTLDRLIEAAKITSPHLQPASSSASASKPGSR